MRDSSGYISRLVNPPKKVITIKDFLDTEAIKVLSDTNETVGTTVMKLKGENVYCQVHKADKSEAMEFCSVKVGSFLVSDIPQYIKAKNIPEFISYRNNVHAYIEAFLLTKCVTDIN